MQNYLKNPIVFTKNQGGEKPSAGSEMSLVSGNYHENKVIAVMAMASFYVKIRHVFGFTCLTEKRRYYFRQNLFKNQQE